MYSVENGCGRLLEIRVASPLTLEEAVVFARRLVETNAAVNEPTVNVVDLRQANVFPPEVVERLIAAMAAVRDRVARSAFLIGPSAIFAMQVERAIQQAGGGDRRAFRDVTELQRWVAEVLTAGERERMARFLAETAPTAP